MIQPPESLNLFFINFQPYSVPGILSAMGLRKEPIKAVGFARWFFPSLAMKALYRRYMPKPNNTDFNYLRSTYHRISIFYALSMFGGFSYLVYKMMTIDDMDMDEFRNQTPVQRSVVGTSYQMLNSERLKDVDKIYVKSVGFDGVSKVTEVKDEIVKVVEKYEAPKRAEMEKARAERADRERRKGETPLLGG